jgi:hypothetical protein
MTPSHGALHAARRRLRHAAFAIIGTLAFFASIGRGRHPLRGRRPGLEPLQPVRDSFCSVRVWLCRPAALGDRDAHAPSPPSTDWSRLGVVTVTWGRWGERAGGRRRLPCRGERSPPAVVGPVPPAVTSCPSRLASRAGRRVWLREAKQRLERERAERAEPAPRNRAERLSSVSGGRSRTGRRSGSRTASTRPTSSAACSTISSSAARRQTKSKRAAASKAKEWRRRLGVPCLMAKRASSEASGSPQPQIAPAATRSARPYGPSLREQSPLPAPPVGHP